VDGHRDEQRGGGLLGGADPFQRYAIQCDDETYFRPTAAAASVQRGGRWHLPAKAWYEHIVLSGATYVSLLNVNFDSDCRIAQCQ